MSGHNHNHGNGHGSDCCHGHGDDPIGEDQAMAYSLYTKIDTGNVECLNEKVDGSGVKVFKPWSERLNTENYVVSDCDAELLYNIPFTGDVKLKGIVIIADQELHKVRLFKSKMKMSFDGANCEADQEFIYTHDPSGMTEYPVKPTKFFNVHHLTIHLINKNREDDEKPCQIYYIGLRGEFTQVNRDGIVIANYEIRPTEDITQKIEGNSREIQ